MTDKTPLSSNEEIINHYKRLAKTYHPDTAENSESKRIFQEKFTEINNAWQIIKKSREI